MKDDFYNGSKLMSLKDINKQTPEIFISTSNRSAGKTTYFGKMLVDDFLKKKRKFGLLYRFAYELNDVAGKFFSDIQGLFFQNYVLTQKSCEKDTFVELFLEDVRKPDADPVSCGYALSLNKADNIKKCSHLLSDIEIMLFDEFQPESGQYCNNEVVKFQSIHTSIARGGGSQVRYLPVIMISNFVTLLNPYYSALGISARLQKDTKYLRGDGWVLEQGYNEAASNAQKSSAFNRAFGDTSYNKFSSEVFYLNDNLTFIKKMTGTNRYIASLFYKGKAYGLRYYPEQMVFHVSKSADTSARVKIALTVDDMTEQTVMMNKYSGNILTFREAFDQGAFRFADLESKEALFAMLSY